MDLTADREAEVSFHGVPCQVIHPLSCQRADVQGDCATARLHEILMEPLQPWPQKMFHDA